MLHFTAPTSRVERRALPLLLVRGRVMALEADQIQVTDGVPKTLHIATMHT